MTDSTPITTQTSASEHSACYEALRRHALEPHCAGASRDALAVLLRHGVAAWMQACSKLPPPAVRTAQDGRERAPLPEGTSAEVVRVLAAMALGQFQEVPS